jgi:hypothetical protein
MYNFGETIMGRRIFDTETHRRAMATINEVIGSSRGFLARN